MFSSDNEENNLYDLFKDYKIPKKKKKKKKKKQ